MYLLVNQIEVGEKMKLVKITLIFSLFLFLLKIPDRAQGLGLSTSFAEVILENLEIGKSYTTKNVARIPLRVLNRGTGAINLKVDVVVPNPGDLKEGCEPIPDASWISFEKDYFPNLKGKETAVTDVIITIPREKKYRGKRYQVYLWSHTISGKGGTSIAVGLNSRLIFSIAGKKKIKRGLFGNILHFFGLKK